MLRAMVECCISSSDFPLYQMVEMASKKFVCIVDDTKLVEGLGGSGGDARSSLLCALPAVVGSCYTASTNPGAALHDGRRRG